MSASETTTASPVTALQLAPPEVLTPLAPLAAKEAVPMKPETRAAVDQQVGQFVDALLSQDIHSEEFKAKLDSAFALGREEVSVAAGLMQGPFMQRNFVGVENTVAFKALQDMRGHLDDLNPGKEGDLLQPNKLLGLIPYGNKLQAYFRKYESAGAQLQKSMQQIYAARDEMQRDVVEIEAVRTQLWGGMQKLGAAIYFAETMDAQLAAKVDALKASDPQRATALQQEVLFYARQNLTDMLTQQAVCTNGYLALDVLKKTGREMMNGCNRVATTGMSALAVAQTVARATGNQIAVMEMLGGVNTAIGALIAESGRQLNTHVAQTAEFAANPMIGIAQIQAMFDQTYQAMDAMDNFRAQAIDVMGQNNAIMKDQLKKSESYVDRVRQQEARAAVKTISTGPVAL